jgi:RNA polymerase sigma-70 factor, ECF subfamily
LYEWRDGDHAAENKLFDMVMPDLRKLAHHLMRGERANHTMQATELVDQVYFRLVAAKNRDWQGRRHFFAIAARAMRRYLIDHARGRRRAEFIAFDGMENVLSPDPGTLETAIAVDRLLDQLTAEQPEWANVVELKYFLGLTDDEAAEVMGMKLRTMQRMWSDARQWLFERMEPSHGPGISRAIPGENPG